MIVRLPPNNTRAGIPDWRRPQSVGTLTGMTQIIPLELVTDFDSQDAALHRGVLAVNHAAISHDGIDDDFQMRPHDIISTLTPMPDRSNAMVAAVVDDQVVGWAETWAALRQPHPLRYWRHRAP